MTTSGSATDEFDYVIVGGGAAGCVLANRLTEDPSTTVCLLEAGPPDRDPRIRIPGGVVKILFNPKLTWQFQTEPSAGTGNRSVYAPQGRTLGGSSAINGMIYNRGQPIDFDSWAQAGNPGWGFSDLLPYFKRSERRIGGDDNEFRGRSGNLPVTDHDWHMPFVDAFIAGVAGLGIPRNPDYNGASQAGVGYQQRFIYRGQRYGAAHAFLAPSAKRPGLDIRCKALVTRILVRSKRASGVAYLHGATKSGGGELREVRARREVIIAAGPINSPKLLQLSGIGAPDLLKDCGVTPVHDLRGVGENLQDHYGARGVVRIRNSRTANDLSRWPFVGWEILKWLANKPSIVGISASIANVFWKSDDALDRPDLQFVLTPISFKAGQFGVLEDFPGMTLGVWPHRPHSRGYVRNQERRSIGSAHAAAELSIGDLRPARARRGSEARSPLLEHARACVLRRPRDGARSGRCHGRSVARLRPQKRLNHLSFCRCVPYGAGYGSDGRGGLGSQGSWSRRAASGQFLDHAQLALS